MIEYTEAYNNAFSLAEKKINHQDVLQTAMDDLKKTLGLSRSIVKRQERRIEFLSINGCRTDNAEIMANEFNSYFANMTCTLTEMIPTFRYPF